MTLKHGAHQQHRIQVNDFIVHPQVRNCFFSEWHSLRVHILRCLATVPTSSPSCLSSALLNPTSCPPTGPTADLQFLFTPCTMGTVSSITPVQGPAGTSITITGTGFSSTPCENIVLLGSSYQCPITSATATQIVCQIAANSLLNAKSIQNVNIARDRQGFLSNDGLLQFQFQASVTSVSPSQGRLFFQE